MQRLTTRQQDIYTYLGRHLEEHGYPPTLREICSEFGMRSTRAASDHLHALERKGFISRARDRSRGIELRGARPSAAGTSVPLVGKIAAGSPLLAQENIQERMTLDPGFLKGDGNFMLEVQGDSMIEAHICSGDYIVVKPQEHAKNGDIVVAMIEDEATVKRLERKGDKVSLVPENRNMQPIVIENPRLLRIVGIVVGLVRRMA
jgi:repressor LexA